jgi:hypothetical protein
MTDPSDFPTTSDAYDTTRHVCQTILDTLCYFVS